MKSLRALALLLACGVARAQEPPPGVEHDSWREVALQPVSAADCLEVAARGHTVRIALGDLRAMALEAGRIMGSATEPRLQRIFEARAHGMLGRVASWPKDTACVRAQALEGDDRYVLAEFLKSGRAAVRAPGAAREARSIWMRHWGRRTGPLTGHGDMLFYVERDGEPFFTVSWWVS